MDTNKFKSVAVRKPDYDILQGLCNQKFRSPASMISKLVNEYVEYQANKNRLTVKDYKERILNVRTVEGRVTEVKERTSVKRKLTRKRTRTK